MYYVSIISEIEFRFVRDIGYFVINLKFHFKINNICHLVSELYLARVNIKRYTGVVAWLYLSISYLGRPAHSNYIGKLRRARIVKSQNEKKITLRRLQIRTRANARTNGAPLERHWSAIGAPLERH